MDFFNNLMKRARESSSTQSSSADPGRQQQSQVNRQHPGGVQHQNFEDPGMDQPVKEIRTYRREGINIIEEYERLNPDGTVTKTISVGDRKDGLKKFEVYKMDKSGIVRRVESSDRGDSVPTEAVRDIWMAGFKNMQDNQKQTREYGSSEGHNTYNTQPSSSPVSSLTQEQKTEIFNDFKDRVLAYGTDKLKSVLIQKLDDKGEELGLTNDQKVELLDHSILKLRRRLSESVNEERFFNEVWPRYVSYKDTQDNSQGSNQVSFTLKPDSNTKQNEDYENRPVSFVIRPEHQTISHQDSASQPRNQEEGVRYSSIPKNVWEHENLGYEEPRVKKEPCHQKSNKDDETIGETVLQLHNHVKRHIKENPSSNKEENEKKEAVLNFTLDTIKKQLKEEGFDVEKYSQTKSHSEEDGRGEKPIDEVIDNLDRYLSRRIMKDPSSSQEEKEVKEYMINHALKNLKKKLRRCSSYEDEDSHKTLSKSEQTKVREESSNRGDPSETDEMYDSKSLKIVNKLFKKGIIDSTLRDDWIEYIKEEGDSSPKRTRSVYRDDISRDEQRKIKDNEGKKNMRDKASSERLTPIDLWNKYYCRSSPPLEEKQPLKENKTKGFSFDSLFPELKQMPSEKLIKDESKSTNKYHPLSSTTSSKSKTASDEESDIEDSFQIFNLDNLFKKMKKLTLGGEKASRRISDNNEEDDYDDNYFPQSRQHENKKISSGVSKEKQTELDFDTIISKLRNDISEKLNITSNSAPKQVKQSSPYSYQKPSHGTTRIVSKNLGNRENENKFSFRINPQDYSKSSNSSYDNSQTSTNKKSYSNGEDFMPWWFGNSGSSNSSYTKEPLIKSKPFPNSILGGSMMDDSFFESFLGSNFSQPQLTNF